MEPPGGVRVPIHVLGESEALQQFFDGEDMSGVLESTVVDTSMLEQYLSNDMDPITFMLPESPPDSGSEPCSPPQLPDVHYCSGWSNKPVNPEVFQPTTRPSAVNQEVFQPTTRPSASSCCFRERIPTSHPGMPPSLRPRGLTNMYIKSGTPPALPSVPAPPLRDPPHQPPYLSPMDSYMQGNTPTTVRVHETLHRSAPTQPQPQPPSMGLTDCYPRPNAPPAPAPGPECHPDPAYPYLPPNPGQHPGMALADCRKRRRSESFRGPPDLGLFSDHLTAKAPYVVSDNGGGGGGGGGEGPSYDSDGANGSVGTGPYQLLTWENYQPAQWCPLYSASYHTLPSPGYHVDTDKGFNYSPADEAFVCQKKNHFQVTVHIGVAGEPKYVKTPSGPAPIDNFQVKVFGIKLEAPDHLVTIEQSQSDRTKKPFLPIRVGLPGDKITKVTLGRLHFSETTANNMRKKGKPNPDQRYFMMVVGLYAEVGKESFLLVALVSERIIVRASNPGQFETDSEVTWQRGVGPEALVCQGRVGINTDAPDEALVVCGNAKIMGVVMHPSDHRAKHNIQEVDSTEQLKRIAQMRIVEFDYRPEFAATMGIDHVHETGVIAQEVKELLPTAVTEVGDVTCSDGEKIRNFLMVDKEQIFMENVGAVKQLCKLTDNLENRIEELEVWNTRLAKLKNMGSLRSSRADCSTGKPSRQCTMPSTPQKPSPLKSGKDRFWEKYSHCLQHKFIQASIITLVSTMAFCIILMTALYMLTLRADDMDTFPGASSVYPTTTTAWPNTVPPTTTPDPGPVDVDFCNLLYCDEVFCCPVETNSTPANITSTTTTPPHPNTSLSDRGQEHLHEDLGSAGDWTNTTMQSFLIIENQQIIDYRYCMVGKCGRGNYTFAIPVSRFVPVNMRITVQMNATELLVVHLCHSDESAECSALLDYNSVDGYAFTNTQGYVHEWPLRVARLFRSSYHFRSTVAGQADCDTDRNYAGALFTDYHFHFYRRCE